MLSMVHLFLDSYFTYYWSVSFWTNIFQSRTNLENDLYAPICSTWSGRAARVNMTKAPEQSGSSSEVDDRTVFTQRAEWSAKNLFYIDMETFKIMVTGSLYPKQGLAYIDLNWFRFFGTNRWRRSECTLNKFFIKRGPKRQWLLWRCLRL